MVKVVNPLFKGNDTEDLANNCRCVCSSWDERDEGKSWTWLPWNTCGCACSGGSDNSNGNADLESK